MTSAKDQLFLLTANFHDASQGPGPFFCRDCATIEGVLSYFPILRERLQVRYIPFDKPREWLVELLGEEHQNCPTLVVAPHVTEFSALLQTSKTTGRQFCTDPPAIIEYLITAYGISRVHI